MPIDEDTHLVESIEASYEEIAAPLYSNNGKLSLVFSCMFSFAFARTALCL